MELKEIKSKLGKAVPDFAVKVQPVYKLLNLEWSPGDSLPHIPSVGEIENTLYTLIEGLTDEYVEVAIGGLSAYYNIPTKESDEAGSYGIAFSLVEEGFFD